MIATMLVIRDEQLRILNRPFEIAFRKMVSEYLASDFPELSLSLRPDGVKDFIEHGIARAAAYGIESEADICDWIGAMAVFGRDFDKLEWAASILQDSAEPLPARVSRLMGWVEAMRNTGPAK